LCLLFVFFFSAFFFGFAQLPVESTVFCAAVSDHPDVALYVLTHLDSAFCTRSECSKFSWFGQLHSFVQACRIDQSASCFFSKNLDSASCALAICPLNMIHLLNLPCFCATVLDQFHVAFIPLSPTLMAPVRVLAIFLAWDT
jgi:hypothetical protein